MSKEELILKLRVDSDYLKNKGTDLKKQGWHGICDVFDRISEHLEEAINYIYEGSGEEKSTAEREDLRAILMMATANPCIAFDYIAGKMAEKVIAEEGDFEEKLKNYHEDWELYLRVLMAFTVNTYGEEGLKTLNDYIENTTKMVIEAGKNS